MIKSKLSLLTLVALGAVVLSTSAKAATYNAGDLILGFRVTGGQGSGKDLLVNLGAATSLRDNGQNSNITNIGTDISDLFGSTWYNRTDLSFGAVACYTNLNTPDDGADVVNGDPGQTIYLTRNRTAHGTPGTASSTGTGTYNEGSMGTISGQILTLNATTYANGTASSNNSAVVIKSNTGTQSYTFFTTPSSDFGAITGGVEQTFAAGAWTTGSFASVTNVEGALDLYRVLQDPADASPTGSDHKGDFLTTLLIDQSGNISAVNAVPEPSTYAMLGLVAVGGVVFAVRRRKLNA